MQLDRAGKRGARRREREQREGVGRDVRLRDRDAAAVHPAVLDLGPIRIARPALARRHDVAVGVERDHRTRAEAAPDHEVGGRDHAVLAHQRVRYRMALDCEAAALQQLRGALGMRGAVARRVVRR
jgi:hypothetical protein